MGQTDCNCVEDELLARIFFDRHVSVLLLLASALEDVESQITERFSKLQPKMRIGLGTNKVSYNQQKFKTIITQHKT